MERDHPSAIEAAALAIKEADVLVFHLGAGMSADSGLRVFADIADVGCYREKNLTYADLCTPAWLDEKGGGEDIFFGFWGSALNDYRHAEPHAGYRVLRKWKDVVVQKQGALTQRMKSVLKTAEPVFVVTSNIDSFVSRSELAVEGEYYEIHGDLSTFQCSKPCTTKKWLVPHSFVFDVDPKTTRYLSKDPDFVPSPFESHNSSLGENLESAEFSRRSFSGSHPRCPLCKAFARPNVLMFNPNDTSLWCRREKAEENYSRWQQSLTAGLRVAPSKVVIVEIGCGLNVPSLRFASERLLTAILREHRSCPPPTLIRINKDNPEVELREHCISLCGSALDVLTRLDQVLESSK